MDYKELVYLGLGEKEAKVYLASLALGKTGAQKIAQKAGVNRGTTYVQIESLMKKGLVSSFHEDKKQYFCAESPEKLSLLFREQELEIKKKEKHLKEIIPELKSMNITDKDRPTVRYFEGKEGLRTMAEEFFITDQKDPAKMIYSFDLLSDIFSEEERKSMQDKRQNKDIKVCSIINDKDKKLKSDAIKHVISEIEFPITSDISFFGDKVRIATQKGPLVGLIIENKEICDTLRILFDLAWKYLDTKKEGSGID